MLCERCKIREANVRYTEIMNGVKTEHNLCMQCAGEMNLGQGGFVVDGDMTIGKLLSGLLGLSSMADSNERLREVVCPTCGTTYEEFVSNSRFGCADCYHVFDLLIGEKIRQLQDNGSHKGKHPKMRPIVQKAGAKEPDTGNAKEKPDSLREEMRQMERALKDAVAAENYEMAAVYRDKLHELREELASSAGPAEESGKKGGDPS
ncbi:UvrB/UvrC motif-containing protein [[Clostridium] aminophilum]|uniref:UvrB/UvrC motif-containing protein n=1 Tax=[Clostridium] aminophilum TaxID=1526 RepID=UPI00331E12A1